MDVVIVMDQGFMFWPVDETKIGDDYYTKLHVEQRKLRIDLDPDTYAKFKELSRQHAEMQSLLEDLYRMQQGLDQFSDTVPANFDSQGE